MWLVSTKRDRKILNFHWFNFLILFLKLSTNPQFMCAAWKRDIERKNRENYPTNTSIWWYLWYLYHILRFYAWTYVWRWFQEIEYRIRWTDCEYIERDSYIKVPWCQRSVHIKDWEWKIHKMNFIPIPMYLYLSIVN